MQGYNIELIRVASSNPSFGNFSYLPPRWLFTNGLQRIHGSFLWAQSAIGTPHGNVSVGIDRGGLYTTTSNYPSSEDTLPILNTSLAAITFPRDTQFTTRTFPEPITLNEDDFFIIANEFSNTGDTIHPLLNIEVDDYNTVYSSDVRVAIRGNQIAGINRLVDWSNGNHQMKATDVTIPNDPAPGAGNPGPLVFNGTSSWVEFRPMMHVDFRWWRDVNPSPVPRPFEMSMYFKTSNSSASNGQFRTIFYGGNSPNYLGETFTPFYLAMDNSGKLIAGSVASFITTPASYDNGVEHFLEVIRDSSNVLSVRINGVVVSSVTDTTLYNAYAPRLGCSSPNGFWDGTIRAFQLRK